METIYRTKVTKHTNAKMKEENDIKLAADQFTIYCTLKSSKYWTKKLVFIASYPKNKIRKRKENLFETEEITYPFSSYDLNKNVSAFSVVLVQNMKM